MKEILNNSVSGEATVTATIANEIFERFVKVFEDTEFDSMHFDVGIDTSKAYCPISIDTDYDEVTIEFSDCCADIIGYEEGAEWTSDEVRWDPENYDVDVVYENIKNAVITVYAGIAECRMRYKFDKIDMIEEMKKLVEPFNEMMKEQVRKKFNDTVGYLVEQIRCNGQKDKGISLYSTTLEYQSDYLYEWRKFAWEQGNVESSVAIEFYRNNVDMFINYDAMDDYVEELADEYGVDDVALFIQGGCRIYMGNPYYEEGVSSRPTAFEIYCKELENVKDGQYVILADCGDGGVLIGKDGKYGFDDLDHAVFIRDEHRFDNSVEVSVYLVQKCMDEYGVVTNELIKCVE